MAALPVAVGIGWVLKIIAVPVVLQVLLALGVGFVTYLGMTTLLDQLETLIIAQISSQTFSDVIGLLGYMNMDRAFSVILSAIGIRMILVGFNVGGSLRTFRLLTGV